MNGQDNTFTAIKRQPFFTNFTTENGLPHNTVYQIIDDSLGRLFFATDIGISIFDGKEFTNYSTRNGLAGNTIFGFHKDFKKRIWYYSFEGKLGYFENEKWHTIKTNDELGERYGGMVISSIHVNQDESILIGYKNNLFKNFVKVENDGSIIEINFSERTLYYDHLFSKDQFVWSNGPDYPTHVDRLIVRKDNDFLDYNPFFLKADDQLFVTNNEFLYQLKEDTVAKILKVDGQIHDYFIDSSFQYVACRKNGVFQVKGDQIINHYLDFTSCYHTFKDFEGGLWFSTENHGVYYWPPGKPSYYPSSAQKEYNSLAYFDENNMVLVSKNEVDRFKITSDQLIKDTTVQFKNINHRSSNSNNLFINDESSSTYHLNLPSLDLIEKYPKTGFYATAINDSSIYFGYHGIRFYKYGSKQQNGLFKNEFNERVFSLKPERNRIIVGTSKGIFLINENTPPQAISTNDPHAKRRVQQILPFGEGYLVHQKGHKLVYWDGKEDQPRFEKVLSNAANLIKLISINKQLVVALFQNHYSTIQRKEGVWTIDSYLANSNQVKRFIDALPYKDSLLILMDKGVFKTPIHTKKEVSPFKVFIKTISTKDSLLNSLDKVFKLEHDQNDLSIRVQAVSYALSDDLEYYYRINKGDWIPFVNGNLQLAGLSAGKYQLQMTARYDNTESINPITLSFSVLAPFWKRWWFITTISIALLLLAYWLGKSYRNQKQSMLEEQLLKQKAQLSALSAQINPHFLFNVFNAIQHLVINQQTKEAIRNMSKFSKLMRYALNLSKYELISLSDEIKFLKLYLELENLRLDKTILMEFVIDKEIEADTIAIPPMLLQILVENAVWHGLQNAEIENKKITIELKKEVNEYLICEIKDNGIGMKNSAKLKSSYGKQHISKGTSLISEKIEIFRKLHKNNAIDLTYHELSADKRFPGTLVTFKFILIELN